MRKLGTLAVVAAVLGLALLSTAFAQGGRGRGGAGRGGGYGPIYNPKTVVTVSGEVVSVEKIAGQGRSYGVHLRLKTAKETVPVHLGPGWYLEEQGFQVKPKDKIEVKGSRVTIERKPAIVAAEVKKDGKVLKLRDGNGFPLWGGRGRRR